MVDTVTVKDVSSTPTGELRYAKRGDFMILQQRYHVIEYGEYDTALRDYYEWRKVPTVTFPVPEELDFTVFDPRE